MSLYLKYRPQTFNDIVAQDHIKKTLQNALKQNQVSHAYLFCGSRGTGKTSTARILAKAVNCQKRKDDSEPCNACEICTAANEGRLVDIIEIDAASNRGIDEIRDLREKIQFSPTQARAKIYIIDEVHMLTKEAFNAILKTLEEPPAHAYFILATTESHKIPETITSRCQHFRFRQFDITDIVQRLIYIAEKENISTDEDGLILIAKQANGSLRDAISLLDQLSSKGDVVYKNIRETLGLVGHQFSEYFLELLNHNDVKSAFESIEKLNRDGYDLEQFCREFLQFLHEKMHQAVSKNNSKHLTEICNYVEIFTKAKNEIKVAIYPQLPLEVAVIKICAGEVSPTEKTDNTSQKKNIEETATQVSPKQEKKSDSKKSVDISLKNITDEWQRVIEQISPASIKLSLRNCRLEKFEKNKLYIAFKSKFHLEKISEESKNKIEIIKALENIFKQKIEIESILQEVAEDEQYYEEKKQEEVKSKNENIQQMIGDIFGDEQK